MKAPAVRVAKTLQSKHNDIVTVFDLRFTNPNTEANLSAEGIHTLEHYDFMWEASKAVVKK